MAEFTTNGNYSQPAPMPVKREVIGSHAETMTHELALDRPPIQTLGLTDKTTADVIGVIQFGQQQIGLLDLGQSEEEGGPPSRYALARVTYDPAASESPVSLLRNEDGSLMGGWLTEDAPAVTLGRNSTSQGFGGLVDKQDMTTSGKHLSLRFDSNRGVVEVQDLQSTNGTAVITRELDNQSQPDAPSAPASEVDEDITRPRSEVAKNAEDEAADPVAVEKSLGSLALSENSQNKENEKDNPSGEQQPSSKTIARAIQELNDAWGLPEDTPLEKIISRLDKEADDIIVALQGLEEFEEPRTTAIHDIQRSLSSGTNQFTGRSRDAIERLLNGSTMRVLSDIGRIDQRLLSRRAKSQLSELPGTVRRLRGQYDATVAKGRTWFNGDAAAQLRRELDRLPEYRDNLRRALYDVQDMQRRTKGYATELTEAKHQEEQNKYRTKELEQWAKELAGDDITPERLEEITVDVQNRIAIENEMQGDPNSPSQWFGVLVRMNLDKHRAQVAHTGRVDRQSVPAQRYVAELAVDMLRGKFDLDLVPDSDSIVLDPNDIGGVEVGQHRVAALAMLYGNKNWQKEARAMGLKIESR